MANSVDAVIAALKVALAEAEKSREPTWKIRETNRWIAQLPGAWRGRWRNLKLKPFFDDGEWTNRPTFISHTRATLAYLETHRDEIAARRSWFSRKASKPAAAAPSEAVDADFEEVPQNLHTLPAPTARTKKGR